MYQYACVYLQLILLDTKVLGTEALFNKEVYETWNFSEGQTQHIVPVFHMQCLWWVWFLGTETRILQSRNSCYMLYDFLLRPFSKISCYMYTIAITTFNHKNAELQ